MGTKKYSDEQIKQAVIANHSIAGVLRDLGLAQAGGTHYHISNRIKALDIDTNHFTGQCWSKGKQLLNQRKQIKDILIVLPPGSIRVKRYQLYRAMIESGVEYICSEDGMGPIWNNKPLTLHIDHRNGNWLDNRLENVRFLCPNCHTQTETYSKPRGGSPIGSRQQV